MLVRSYPDISVVISAQFILEMCATAENCKKNTKNPYFEGSRLFKVIDVVTAEKHVISACYDKQHGCVYSIFSRFHVTRANSGKITTFGGTLFDARVYA